MKLFKKKYIYVSILTIYVKKKLVKKILGCKKKRQTKKVVTTFVLKVLYDEKILLWCCDLKKINE